MQYQPQRGFQMQFLTNPAQIKIGGGSAGCSKTFSMLLDTFRYMDFPGFNLMMFRREMTDVKMPGGVWDEAVQLYGEVFGSNAIVNKSNYSIKKKEGNSLRFGGIQYETDLINLQGLQSPGIYIDEVTTFSESMFWFLFSRNRNSSKFNIEPFVMATCNPDPDSFVFNLIQWYIGEDGFPIPERAGKIRYMLRMDGEVFFYDSYQDCYFKNKIFLNEQSKIFNIDPQKLVKTFSFIPGKIAENRELLKRNPTYLSNLLALDSDQKARYLDGNWKVKIDEKTLCHHDKIEELFTNYVDSNQAKYITCDPSRHGKDFTVIMLWHGWTVIECHVWKLSDSTDVYTEIEKLRAKHNIPVSRVCIDADGVGYDTLKLGRYVPFRGGSKARYDDKIKIKQSYPNFKTQCAYYFSQRVNINDVAVRLVADSCSLDGRSGIIKVKSGGRVQDFRDLIKADLRSVKRADSHSLIQAIIHKDKQKEILGRSPDFSDTLFLRCVFDLTIGSW